MNTNNNQRFKDTENKILNAYGKLASQKDLDKITVSDICRLAEIHRTTFYGHFLDIPDLRDFMIKHRFRQLIEQTMEDGKWNLREAVLEQVYFYYRSRKIIKRIMQNRTDLADTWKNGNHKNHVDHLGMEWTPEQQNFFTRTLKCQSQAEQEYYLGFYEAGFLEILKRWILADCPESPEEITRILCRLFGVEDTSLSNDISLKDSNA